MDYLGALKPFVTPKLEIILRPKKEEELIPLHDYTKIGVTSLQKTMRHGVLQEAS